LAKFNFRLQNFLGIKEKLERQKEIEYGLAIQQLNAEKQKLSDMMEEREFCITEFQVKISKRIDPETFKRYNDYIEVMKIGIKAQELEMWKAQEFANKKHKELIKAMQERKAMEKLRERAFEEFTENEKLEEKRINDDLVTLMYAK